jgi:drug/metabolite transporter (DMT)-like permease
MTKDLLAYIELTFAMIFLGVMVVTGKVLVASISIFLLLGIRFFIGFVFFSGYLYWQEKSLKITYTEPPPLTRKEYLILFLQALFGGFLFNVFMLYGLKLSTASATGILTSTTPVFTTLLAFIFLREKITHRKLLAIVIAVIGVAIVNINTGDTSILKWNLIGNFFIILAVISGAFLTIYIKKIAHRVTALGMSLVFNLFSALLFFPLALWEIFYLPSIHIDMKTCFLILIYTISGSIIFTLLWNKGVSKINASTASLFTGIMPISTVILAYTFLSETITVYQLIGMIAILLAIYLDVNTK